MAKRGGYVRAHWPAGRGLLIATHALAEETLTERDYLLDLSIVLSASRLAQPFAEAPNAVTVIDRETIRASGFGQIPELFWLVPGSTSDTSGFAALGQLSRVRTPSSAMSMSTADVLSSAQKPFLER